MLLIGDLRGYLDLAMEIAPFYRAGQESEAQSLEAILEAEVFPCLEPEVGQAFTTLKEAYSAVRTDLTPARAMVWGEGVLSILSEPLIKRGLLMQHRLQLANEDPSPLVSRMGATRRAMLHGGKACLNQRPQ